MPRKLVEAAFRHKLLLALPIVLVPALVFLFYPNAEDEYVSETTVWVETPSFAAQVTPAAPVYPVLTPAQQQAEVLRQMLTTRSFRENAAIDAKLVTPEAPEADRSEAATEIGERIAIVERGENLIAIEARGTSPQHAQALALGFLKEYNDRVIFEAGRTTQLTTDYYMGQLNLAQAELAKRREEAQAYLTAHPKAYESKAPDFTYDSLIARVNEQAAVVDDLMAGLQAAQREAATEQQRQLAGFAVQDPPNLPTSSAAESLLERGLPLAAGLAFGAAISAGFLFVTYRTDRSIRSSEDLAGVGVPLLGTVPRIRARHAYLRWVPWPSRSREARGTRYARYAAAGIASHAGGRSAIR